MESNKKYILCTIILSLFAFSNCKNEGGQQSSTIIDQYSPVKLSGNVVIRGEEDLIISNDIILSDSMLVVIDISPDLDRILKFYDLNTFKKLSSWGARGLGPEDFLFPMSINSPYSAKNQLYIYDLELHRHWNIDVSQDSVNMKPLPYFDKLDNSFNLNLTKDSIYFGTKMQGLSNGLYFSYDSTNDSINWVDCPSLLDKEATDAQKYISYYSTLSVNDNKKIVAVALRYTNKVLFFDYDGNILKEILIGNKEIRPKWDDNAGSLKEGTPICFIDMAITNNYIYCLYLNGKEEKSSEILIFDWNFNFQKALLLDKPIMRIEAMKDDSFILGLMDDGTGLTNIVKYDINIGTHK